MVDPQGMRYRQVDEGDGVIAVSAQFNDEAPGGSLASDVDIIMRKIGALLDAKGASFADIAKLAVYYRMSSGASETDIMRQIGAHFDFDDWPALSMIPLRHLPRADIDIQIEALAVNPHSARAKQRIAARDATPYPLRGGFSHAVRYGDLVFSGAQMSLDENGAPAHADDIVSQAALTVANLGHVLESVGSGLKDVVKLNTFYVGNGTTDDWTKAAKVRSDAFTKPGPGATGVPVPGPYPDGFLLRQDAIAVVGSDGSVIARETSWPESVWDWPIRVSFEQGLKLDRLLVLGGQISANRSGETVHAGDIFAQAVRTMEAIAAILDGFDASPDDLAKVTILYATEGEPDLLPRILDTVAPFFKRGLPAFTAIALDKLGLSGGLIEIEGFGALGHADKKDDAF